MEYAKKELYDPKRDEMFQKPVVDAEEMRERRLLDGSVVSYQYVHGRFEGTGVKFLFCVPKWECFEGRFYQHLSPFPGPDEELAATGKNGEEDFIAFALSHGSAYVESNMGADRVFGTVEDATIFYRSSAAVAEQFRQYVRERCGAQRVYGYVYGGSGGGYKTMSCIENTAVWDGAVPFVIGSPMSLPNCLTVAAHGSRLLRHCWDKIVDALEPGGSGDMYEGLNQEERDALTELYRIGFPPRVCGAFGSDDDGSLPVLAPVVKQMDPDYFTDFWTRPGYLGTAENSSAVRDRICMRTRVAAVGIEEENGAVSDAPDGRNGTDDAWQKMMADAGAAYLEAEEVPQGDDLFLRGVDILFESGAAKGKRLRLKAVEGNRLIPGMSYGADDFREVLQTVRPGDAIFLDNSDYIAIQTYHRHQVPEDKSFHAWDQYRDAQGNPIYPQRDTVIAFGFTRGGCGSVQDGRIQGKVIVMNSLMDGDFPWQADWYKKKVEEVYGADAENVFRLWYNDNCPHGDVSECGDMLHVVSYLGMLRQALLDVAKWAETGAAPTDSTGYELADNQVLLSPDVKTRGGIQPLVRLSAEGREYAHAKAGQQVRFMARIEMPQAAGALECVQWSFEGEQDYPHESSGVRAWQEEGIFCAEATAEHAFERPGTYFCAVRVISNRNRKDGYTRLRNLARVRVVVE